MMMFRNADPLEHSQTALGLKNGRFLRSNHGFGDTAALHPAVIFQKISWSGAAFNSDAPASTSKRLPFLRIACGIVPRLSQSGSRLARSAANFSRVGPCRRGRFHVNALSRASTFCRLLRLGRNHVPPINPDQSNSCAFTVRAISPRSRRNAQLPADRDRQRLHTRNRSCR